MLRVLTLATLFPNRARPTLGVFVERQTQALAARPGVEVEVVAPVGLPVWPLSLHPHYAPLRTLPARERWHSLDVHRPRYRVWPGIGRAGVARAMAEALLPLLGEIRERFPFDVIDAEYFWPDGPAAMRLAEALDVPFSVKARGSDIYGWGARPGISEQIVAAGQAAAGLLAVSGALRTDMIALGLPADKIRVHHTGIDLGAFRPDAGKRTESPLLITPGHLIPRKGQEVALAALEQIPAARLLLVGDGPDRAKLERIARQHGLTDRVRFLGARPHAELPALLASADVTVLPTDAEGLANVWVESLACGTPVVTCDVGGARDVVDRPEAGRLVPREPGAIAAAVRELLADPPDPEAVRKAAERFSWEKNGAELAAHLAGAARAA
jgi:teichuronic acid biosynthesis glycosyltransferase TuaC